MDKIDNLAITALYPGHIAPNLNHHYYTTHKEFIMKNFSLVFSALFILSSLNLATAQETLAVVDLTKTSNTSISSSMDELVIDRTAISELSDLISDHVEFPHSALSFSNTVSVKVQVSMNEFGELISYHILNENSINAPTGKSIMTALSKIDRVTPILVNGLPKAMTVQIPLVFRL